MHPSEHKLTNVTLGDLASNPRGGKTAPLLTDGKQLRLKLRGVTTPFSCTAFDKQSTRRALDVRTDAALRDLCAKLDAVVLPFAKKLTCSESGYKSLAKQQKEYEPLFRMKLTLGMIRPNIRIWPAIDTRRPLAVLLCSQDLFEIV